MELAYIQSAVWSQAAEGHYIEPPRAVPLIFTTTYGADHDIVEIRYNNREQEYRHRLHQPPNTSQLLGAKSARRQQAMSRLHVLYAEL